MPAAALSISVIYIPQYFRVVRNHTLAVREEAFVDAARAMGAPPRVIIVRYVAANVLQSVPVIFTVNAADAVLTLAGLGFLGYGVPLRTAEWGFDIGNAISDVGTGAWWTSLFPGLAIVLLVTGMSLLGEGDQRHPQPPPPGRRHGARRPRSPASTPKPAPPRPRPPPPRRLPMARPEVPPTADAATGRRRRARTAPLDPGRGDLGAETGDSAGFSTEMQPGRRPPCRPWWSRACRVTYRSARGPVRAVEGVSLAVGAGESVGLVGESGCGKSTLGRAVLGVLPAVAERTGRVVLDGVDLTADADAWRQARGDRLSLVFQDPATRLDPLQRMESHFVELIRAHRPGTSKADAARLGRETLAAVGVPPARARQYPHEFSGGMRQRIMIALAVVLEPRVLVADEPTTSLDVLVEAQILDLLTDLRRAPRPGRGPHHPQPRDRGRDLRPGGRDVRRPDRRGGPGGRGLRRPPPPLHPGPARRRHHPGDARPRRPSPAHPPTWPAPSPAAPSPPAAPWPWPSATRSSRPPTPVGTAHTAACHLYPGADPTHPAQAWEPAGRRLRLAEPPLAGTLR